MNNYEQKLKEFSKELYSINAIKFGEYKTKIGLMTPVYCDLRLIVSYPKLMITLSELLIEKIRYIKDVDLLCGVPYTALPISTAVSIKTDIPMVMRRKEAKDYGTKKLIEGIFQPGQKCLIIEDVVTSGSSILETVKDLKGSGLICTDAVVLLNREQGGEEILKNNGINMYALLKMTQLMDILKEAGCIDDNMVLKVEKYLATTKVDKTETDKITENRLHLTFESRALKAKNKIAQKLFQIMQQKRTTLCVAADVLSTTELLNLAEQVGPNICALKTHIDILQDFHQNLIGPLQEISQRHNFILFEDRKFADIGKTVEYQYSKGIYQISCWAPLVTVHSLMGRGALDAIKGSKGLVDRGVFLLAEASADGNLINENYIATTLKIAEEYSELVAGIVCQNPLFLHNPGFIQLCPGVQIDNRVDDLGQKYNSPDTVVLEKGADIAVVGRGITKASDPVTASELYRKLLWEAYEKRLARHN
ncbi:uridine 5'-monophosphate synthase [Diorhabda carinulata]|uniref:uridine 5'-monophosphate synthase n=1 Tax=Diorhabda carinulata TaxID=1163345 RepID=UPI0025A18748|nr:uridine 5'-monophosphate synthase [Diorhabda carinulata]XP_057658167.1 uridine 5'-monophosphate synthase [Diorhabda carinulata]